MPKFKVKVWMAPYEYTVKAKDKKEAADKVMQKHFYTYDYDDISKIEAEQVGK